MSWRLAAWFGGERCGMCMSVSAITVYRTRATKPTSAKPVLRRERAAARKSCAWRRGAMASQRGSGRKSTFRSTLFIVGRWGSWSFTSTYFSASARPAFRQASVLGSCHAIERTVSCGVNDQTPSIFVTSQGKLFCTVPATNCSAGRTVTDPGAAAAAAAAAGAAAAAAEKQEQQQQQQRQHSRSSSSPSGGASGS